MRAPRDRGQTYQLFHATSPVALGEALQHFETLRKVRLLSEYLDHLPKVKIANATK